MKTLTGLLAILITLAAVSEANAASMQLYTTATDSIIQLPQEEVKVLPTGCTRGYTLKENRRYIRNVYARQHISNRARTRMKEMRKCLDYDRQERPRIRAKVIATTQQMQQWRKDYHCTQSKVVNCIRAASKRWNVSFPMMLRKARCESGLRPTVIGFTNHYGLFQFLPSTFATTPYRGKPITSAKWNSLAAAWMHSVGRGNEWQCR